MATTKPIVRNKFTTVRSPITFKGESMTKQEFKDECDINNILTKYRKTGNVFHLNHKEANYGVADAITFQDAMNTVVEAQDMFDELSSDVRKKFNHNPAEFMEYIHSDPDKKELYDLGLLSQEAMASYDNAVSEPEPGPEPAAE